MIPYKDINPSKSFPFVTIAIIAMNVAVFVWEYSSPSDVSRIVYKYGAIPSNLLGAGDVSIGLNPGATIITSMFLHGGILHLIGNMLYLWIFGDNVEDSIGHFRFVAFYLLCGIAAAYSQSAFNPASRIPMIGASGAVAGVLGAYILLFPRARVYTLVFLGFFIEVVEVPALIVIGFWAIIQVLSGLVDKLAVHEGGVAWFAHLGGFLFGLITVKLFMYQRYRRQRVW